MIKGISKIWCERASDEMSTKTRMLPFVLLLSSTPALAQSVPAVPGVPTNSGTALTWVAQTFPGPFCNKVYLINAAGQIQTWAISAADWNASGRWAEIMALYTLQLSGHPVAVSFVSSADPSYVENTPVSPVTYCSGGDGMTKVFPNPANIIPAETYK